VAAGKVADLLLLHADPLADIANSRRISVVVANGRVLTADDRRALLAGVEKSAR
jgi:imidazolonepropionase-like amidohydrolase